MSGEDFYNCKRNLNSEQMKFLKFVSNHIKRDHQTVAPLQKPEPLRVLVRNWQNFYFEDDRNDFRRYRFIAHSFTLIIFPTNKGVNDHNTKVIVIMKRNGQQIVKLKAQDEFLDPT